MPDKVSPNDRVFFVCAGFWFLALTLIGFSPTFYFRTMAEPLPLHQVVHGIVYSAWVLLFFIQVILISKNRIQWHRNLGMASVILLLLMIPVGFYVVLIKTAAGDKSIDDAGFNITELTLGFAFAFSGLASRKRPMIHKRLMMFALLMLTVAAADRVAYIFGLDEVRLFRKLLAVFPAIALVCYDLVLRQKIVFLSISCLVLVWLVLWFLISDLIFLRPMGEEAIRILTQIFVL